MFDNNFVKASPAITRTNDKPYFGQLAETNGRPLGQLAITLDHQYQRLTEIAANDQRWIIDRKSGQSHVDFSSV
jgi:hypothetical protein